MQRVALYGLVTAVSIAFGVSCLLLDSLLPRSVSVTIAVAGIMIAASSTRN